MKRCLIKGSVLYWRATPARNCSPTVAFRTNKLNKTARSILINSPSNKNKNETDT